MSLCDFRDYLRKGEVSFNIFINDLLFWCVVGYVTHSTLLMIIHYHKVTMILTFYQTSLLDAVSSIALTCFDDNCMHVNAGRFQVTILPQDPNIASTIKINGVLFSSTDIVKLLVLKIDKLAFDQHMYNLC